MAVITEINGVSTSGTTGVNNIFGSGTGGGSSSPSTAPVINVGSATTYGGNTLMVMNSLSYSKPLFNLVVTDPNGTEVVSTAADYETFYTAGFYVMEWSDVTATTGTYTISLSVVDADASPEEVESSVTTATYTKANAQFKYIRLYGLDSSGDRGLNHTKTTMIADFHVYTEPNNSGTQLTGFGGQATYNTSNTSNPDFEWSAGHNFNNYFPWEVNDSNFSSTGSAWWSLGRNNSNENYIQLKFLNQSENASSQYATDADLPLVKSVRAYASTSGNCNNLAVFASTTGAFAGEEVQIGSTLSNSPTGYKSFSL